MPFGWFGDTKKLEQQKLALAACTESLADLEKRVAHLAHLQAKFADVRSKDSSVPMNCAPRPARFGGKSAEKG